MAAQLSLLCFILSRSYVHILHLQYSQYNLISENNPKKNQNHRLITLKKKIKNDSAIIKKK